MRTFLARLVCVLVGATGCARVAHPLAPSPAIDLLIVAPHPDDEVLMTAGILQRARATGRRAAVVVVTNGDYTCERDGHLRQRESVAALGTLGVAERDVHFLGYPDGHLAALGTRALAPLPRRDASGRCVRAAVTYGTRGAGRADEHTARTGRPAPYTAQALTEDLAAVIRRTRPREIYVTHAIDEHPDHAMTYAYLRRALEATGTRHAVRLHRFVVHAGACWPNGSSRWEPCPAVQPEPSAPFPPLPAPLTGYAPTERVAVPTSMRVGDLAHHPKFIALAHYASQLGPEPARDWLATFVRADEVFYPETLVEDPLHRGRRVRRSSDRAPAAIEVRAVLHCAAGATEGGHAALRLGSAHSPQTAYVLALDASGARLTLRREQAASSTPLRVYALPEDDTRQAAHTYALRVDPRHDEDGVTEVTLRRDGQVLGVAVDISASLGAFAPPTYEATPGCESHAAPPVEAPARTGAE